jgi:hypothetical protein
VRRGSMVIWSKFITQSWRSTVSADDELHEDLYCKFVIVHSQSGVTLINKTNKCQKYIHEKNVKKLKKRERKKFLR